MLREFKPVKVPTVVHLSRVWRDSPDGVKRALISLSKSSPPFSYDDLFKYIRNMLVLKKYREFLLNQISQKTKGDLKRVSFSSVAPLLFDYLGRYDDYNALDVMDKSFGFSSELRAEFKPKVTLMTGSDGVLPQFIFWKTNPLTIQQKSLMLTMIDLVMQGEPDLEDLRLELVDFSAAKGAAGRRLTVSSGNEIPRCTSSELTEMLEIFAEGYRLANEQLRSEFIPSVRQSSSQKIKKGPMDGHPGLFD